MTNINDFGVNYLVQVSACVLCVHAACWSIPPIGGWRLRMIQEDPINLWFPICYPLSLFFVDAFKYLYGRLTRSPLEGKRSRCP